MACPDASQVYTVRNFSGDCTGQNQQYELRAQSYTDNQAYIFLVQGNPCALVKGAFMDGGPLHNQLMPMVLQPGTVIDFNEFDFSVVNGDPANYSTGTTVQADGEFGFLSTVGIYTGADSTAGTPARFEKVGGQTWPLVLGVNCTRIVISTGPGNVGHSDWVQWVGNSSQPALSAINYDAWFCCLQGGLCPDGCGGPAPIVSQSFLIPRPTNPDPVEENTSTPILKSPLYLANHTFQFVNNFGRLTK